MEDSKQMQSFDPQMEWDLPPLSRQIEILQGLGLTIPEDIIQEASAKGEHPSDFHTLLAEIGSDILL